MNKMLAALTLLLLSAPLFAQSKAKPVDVTVHQVNDRRTSGSFSQLSITLELPKIASADVAASRSACLGETPSVSIRTKPSRTASRTPW